MAALVSKLHLQDNKITVQLVDDSEDEEGEEEDEGEGEETKESKKKRSTRPVFVDIDLSLTARANAGAMFSEKKRAAAKARATEERAAQAVEEMTAKMQLGESKKRTSGKANASVRIARKSFWFEKFHWFITSEGVLVLGGKDAHQNEQLFKRFLRKGYAYLHADIHGAPTVIVRNPYHRTGTARTVPYESMKQAGVFCVCKSPAWQAKIVTSAWWVESHQVSRTAPSGEFLPTGSFMIRGKKNYLQPTRLEMGFGYIFKIDLTAKELPPPEEGGNAVKEDEEENAKDWRFLRGKLPPLDEEVLKSLETLPVGVDDAGQVVSVIQAGNAVPSGSSNANKNKGGVSKDKAKKASDDKVAKGSDGREPQQSSSRPIPQQQQQQMSATASRKKLLKQKRAKEKYADQTEEERRLAMIALGHVRHQTPDASDGQLNEREDEAEDADVTNSEDESNAKPSTGWLKSNAVASANPVKEAVESKPAETEDTNDDEEEDEDKPVQIEDDDEGDAVGPEEGELLTGFTPNPRPGDIILLALPFCAPIEAMSNFKFRVKLTPGTLKKGKAAKQAVALFQSRASERERAVINSVTDPENVAVMMCVNLFERYVTCTGY